MIRSKHTEAQMITALKQVVAGRTADDVARQYGVSKHTIYAWKSKYGGMDMSEAECSVSLIASPVKARYTCAGRAIERFGKPQTIRCDNGP